jgi:hypothetical protein
VHRRVFRTPTRRACPTHGGGAGPDQLFFADAEVPRAVLESLRELRHQKTFIHPLEEIGVVAPYFSPELQDLLRDRLVLLDGERATLLTPRLGETTAGYRSVVLSASHS